jgi:hypothetical protein
MGVVDHGHICPCPRGEVPIKSSLHFSLIHHPDLIQGDVIITGEEDEDLWEIYREGYFSHETVQSCLEYQQMFGFIFDDMINRANNAVQNNNGSVTLGPIIVQYTVENGYETIKVQRHIS